MPGETAWSPWFPRMKLRTDAAGRFELTNLPDGPEFSVRYMAKGTPPPGRYTCTRPTTRSSTKLNASLSAT